MEAIRIFFFLFILSVFLQGCASSAVSRQASNNIDDSVQTTKNLWNSDGSMANAYQNTSQTTKGVLIGGAAGAAVGQFSPVIGLAPGLASGAILGGAIGAYIDSYTTLSDKLANRGVKVIVLGDQVKMIVSSSRIFDDFTPRINTDAYSTLDLMAQQINQYPNMMVTVSAYVNNAGPSRINRALSQQQAESVSKYFWRTKLNTRVLYAVGMGDSNLVMINCPSAVNQNYRLEITLEKLPV